MKKADLIHKKQYLIKHNNPQAIYHNQWSVVTYYKDIDCFNLNPTISQKHISKIMDIDNISDPEKCNCSECKKGYSHKSDCAVHNEPAERNGVCDCKCNQN